MPTLLDMVNDVRGMLREERVAVLPSASDFTSDPISIEVIALVNRAISEVLEDNAWPFRHQYRMKVSFYKDVERTGTIAAGATTATFSLTLAEEALFAGTHDGTANFRGVLSLLVTDSADFSRTGYKVMDYTRGTTTATLETSYLGTNATEFRIFCNEMVLPLARKVVDVRHQEQPLTLIGANQTSFFNRAVPGRYDTFSAHPTHYYTIGGEKSTSFTTAQIASANGIGLGIWPIPDETITLDVTYEIINEISLTSATDQLLFVPRPVVDLITHRAYQYALASDIQNDPERAGAFERVYERRLARLQRRKETNMGRRRVLRSFGRRGTEHGLYRPWDKRVVDTP